MNNLQLKKYEALLQNMRADVTNQDDVSVKADKSGLAHEILDEDTQPLSEMNQVIASNRNRNRAASLGKIDTALKRLQNQPDEFGLCLDCGEDIAPKRLELMPFAEFCAACQNSRDQENKPGRRRHLTDYK